MDDLITDGQTDATSYRAIFDIFEITHIKEKKHPPTFSLIKFSHAKLNVQWQLYLTVFKGPSIFSC